MSPFIVLVRHFHQRFFDNEAVSPRGDMHVSIGNVLALLALPAVLIIPAFLLPKYALTAFGAPATLEASTWFDKLFYLSWSMAAMGLITVLQWDALFPDRRDYAVLTPLPIRLRTVFAAKLSALLGFLAIFSLALANISPVFYPLILLEAQPRAVTIAETLRYMTAHTVAVLAASVFVFSFLVALEGVLMLLLGGRGFRRIARYVQLLAIFALLAMFLFFPTFSDFLYPKFRHPEWIAVFPPMWFLGIYEILNGSVRPMFVPLAETGVRALGFSALAAAVAYTLSYARVYRRSLEQVEVAPGPGPIERALARLADRLILRRPAERAGFWFVVRTLLRSGKHRLYFFGYLGVGLALVLVGLVHFLVNTRNANIWQPNAALLSVPLVISFFALSGMRVVFGMPAELRANWVFQLTAAAHWSAILAGVRKAMLWLAILPLLVLSVPVYALLWGWPVALAHLLVCLLLSLILVELLLARFPKIPFTCTYVPGGANLTYAWAFYWVAFSTYAYTMASIEWMCLRRPLSTAVFCAVLAGIWWLLAARRREALGEGFEVLFEDGPAPDVTVLNLNQHAAAG